METETTRVCAREQKGVFTRAKIPRLPRLPGRYNGVQYPGQDVESWLVHSDDVRLSQESVKVSNIYIFIIS